VVFEPSSTAGARAQSELSEGVAVHDAASPGPADPTFSAYVRRATIEATVIELAGDLDIAGVETFNAVVGAHLGCPQVHLDLTAVTFLDCAGLAAIITVHDQLRRHNGQLVLHHIPRAVHQILELTGAVGMLATEESPPDRGLA
jgi:anti-anti-sigma factor